MEEYEGILINRLRIKMEYLRDSRDRIRDRLLDAYRFMTRRQTDMIQDDICGINQCIHLAGNVVLLGCEASRISETLESIKNNGVLSGLDPTIVLSATALRYLLKDQVENGQLSDEQREGLLHITKRFKEINWMVGRAATDALGLNR